MNVELYDKMTDDERLQYIWELEHFNDELEKALDKATNVLAIELNACCKPNEDFTDECGVNCKKHWKEYLLQDE